MSVFYQLNCVLTWLLCTGLLGMLSGQVLAERSEVLVTDMSRARPYSLLAESDSRQEVFITDFSVCQPASFISREPSHAGIWQLVDYQAEGVSGVGLLGTQTTHAQPITVPLDNWQVHGWYEIRYAMWDLNGPASRSPGDGLRAKLTSDPHWSQWHAHQQGERPTINEYVWRVADLTNEQLHLAQLPWHGELMHRCALAWIRLIPIGTPTTANVGLSSWRLSPYSCAKAGIEGTGIEVDEDCWGKELVLPLPTDDLTGWYDIYLGIYDPGSRYNRYYHCGLQMRLSGEDKFDYVPLRQLTLNQALPAERGKVVERLWKRAQLDDQDLHIAQWRTIDTFEHNWKADYLPFNVRGGLAWVRLVPAPPPSAQSVRRSVKPRLVCWSDIWDQITQHLANSESEVESLLDWLQGEPYNTIMVDSNAAVDKTSYPTEIGQPAINYEVTLRYLDKAGIDCRRDLVQQGINVHSVLARRARELGLEYWAFLRMGAWGYAQPFQLLGGPFFKEHPEYRAIDRNGQPWHTVSYAFPEVRQYVVDLFREICQHSRADGGKIDGIVLGFCRGPIFIDYEPHVCDAFASQYGEDPRQLPEDDQRWLRFRAQYITALLEELQPMLAEESAAQGSPIKLVADCYGNESINLRFGLDVKQWVARGLVDVLQISPDFAGGEFDRNFYKQLRAQANGKVEFVIGHLSARQLPQWREQFLNDFDGLLMSGPTSPAGTDELFPPRITAVLDLRQPLPSPEILSGEQAHTDQRLIQYLQGIPIGKPFYAAGL